MGVDRDCRRSRWARALVTSRFDPCFSAGRRSRNVAGLLEPSGYFGDEPTRIGIAKELVPDAQAEQQAAAAARAADRLAWSLSSADFAKMKSSQSAADLLSLSSAGAQIPAELGKLRELVRRVLVLHEPPDGAGKAQDTNALEAIFSETKERDFESDSRNWPRGKPQQAVKGTHRPGRPQSRAMPSLR